MIKHILEKERAALICGVDLENPFFQQFAEDLWWEKTRALLATQRDATVKDVVAWSKEDCPHSMMADMDGGPDISLRKKAICPRCWEELEGGR